MFIYKILQDDLGGKIFLSILFLVTIIVPILNLLVPSDSIFYLSTYTVTIIGKYLTYALLTVNSKNLACPHVLAPFTTISILQILSTS